MVLKERYISIKGILVKNILIANSDSSKSPYNLKYGYSSPSFTSYKIIKVIKLSLKQNMSKNKMRFTEKKKWIFTEISFFQFSESRVGSILGFDIFIVCVKKSIYSCLNN
jgi:hypothetical protein